MITMLFVYCHSYLLDIVDHSCKPQVAHVILNEEGMKEALHKKLVISILAGVTISQMTDWVTPETRLVRAMPNTPCKASSVHTCPVDTHAANRFGKE